ncbi:hypothetical protein AKO1_001750 [Acrasis kona]|uniref:Uncharacterized protein n=1 Tax=Acrasis kona TaxID=1008807 RepID=A0AAW2Z9J2_9EUKA
MGQRASGRILESLDTVQANRAIMQMIQNTRCESVHQSLANALDNLDSNKYFHTETEYTRKMTNKLLMTCERSKMGVDYRTLSETERM